MEQTVARHADAKSTSDRSFFGHPRGLSVLFFTEMWERFSYYGTRALLILFMTNSPAAGGFGLDVRNASAIYGLYTSMVYLLSVPGGWIADRFIGQRRAVFYGGILIAAGNFLLVVHDISLFLIGLLVITVGTGLLKPNVSTMVGHLYAASDSRRDAGFSIFYMGINLGAFLSPLVCSNLGEKINWHLGFAMAGIGMTLGTVQYLLGSRHLGEAGLHSTPAETPEKQRRLVIGLWTAIALGVGFVAMLAVMTRNGSIQLTPELVSKVFGVGLLLAVFCIFASLFFGRGWTLQERKRFVVVFGLFIAATIFWSVFEQQGSTLNLFADRNTDREFFGYTFPAGWFQSLNALFIVSFAPVFAWRWIRLGSSEPSSPAKFVLGLVSAGLGFVLLIIPATSAMAGEKVSPLWLIGTFLLHTCGELCLSPVGLSAMTKLAPVKIGGFLMGVWFLTISIGNYLGGRASAFYETPPLPTLFGVVVVISFTAAIVMALFVRPMKGLAGGVK